MSAIRLTAPRRVTSPAPRALQAAAPSPSRSRMFSIAKVVFFGFVITQIAQLILGITVTQSAYELKALKVEKAELTTQSQIVGQQVDSLTEQQVRFQFHQGAPGDAEEVEKLLGRLAPLSLGSGGALWHR